MTSACGSKGIQAEDKTAAESLCLALCRMLGVLVFGKTPRRMDGVAGGFTWHDLALQKWGAALCDP